MTRKTDNILPSYFLTHSLHEGQEEHLSSLAAGPAFESASQDYLATISSSLPSKSKKDSADVTVSVTVTAATTNADLNATICSRLGNDTVSLFVYAGTWFGLFLPDCVYTQRTSLKNLLLQNVVIRGLETPSQGADYIDPLLGLPSSLTTFSLNSVSIRGPADTTILTSPALSAPFVPNWAAFFASHSQLVNVRVTTSNIGGPLPSAFPAAMTFLQVANSALNGTIPNTLTSNMSTSLGSLTLDFTNNQLTGTIPSLLADKSLAVMTGSTFLFSGNQLFGSLPTSFANNLNASKMTMFQFYAANNKLEGSIPSTLFGNFLSTIFNLYVDLSFNALSGTVPPTLFSGLSPSSITLFSVTLQSNQLTGTFPSFDLLSFTSTSLPINQIDLNLGQNRFTGSLPTNLFAANSSSLITTCTIRGDGNQLSGSLPPALLASLPPIRLTLSLDFSSNDLSGPIPVNFIHHANLTNLQTFYLSLGNNRLSGDPFSTALTFSTTGVYVATITLSNNEFSGTIPENFCVFCLSSYGTPSLTINLDGNYFTGAIPSTLLSAVTQTWSIVTINLASNQLTEGFNSSLFSPMSSSPKTTKLSLSFANNSLSGPLDFDMLAPINWQNTAMFTLSLASNNFNSLTSTFLKSPSSLLRDISIYLDNNPFDGPIPNDLLKPYISAFRSSYLLSLTNCGLTGTLPTNMFGTMNSQVLRLDHNQLEGFPNMTGLWNVMSVSTISLIMSASHNLFNGSLEMSNSIATPTYFSLDFSYNNLTSLVINNTNATQYITHLYLSNNPLLEGTLENWMVASISSLRVLDASHTSLSGILPNLGLQMAQKLTVIHLNNTQIDFCSGTRTLFRPSSLSQCSLFDISTTSSCEREYPPQCFGLASFPPLVPPSTPPSTPPTAPSTAPFASCSGSTRPSEQFTCINGVWTASTVIELPTLVLPPGATETIVTSDVTSTSIVFNSLGSTLIIGGCANNLTTVTVTLTPSELSSYTSGKTQLLISYQDNNSSCSDFSQVQLVTSVKGSSCRKVSVSKATGEGTLSGVFTINSSKCNTWWIILVSVIAAVVVLVIIVVLLVVFVPSVRAVVRPFVKRQNAA